MVDSIRIGDPAIEVALRHHARARRMVLRVPRHGAGPILTLPLGATVAEAQAFVGKQEGWLRLHVAIKPPIRRVAGGATLPFRGRTVIVRVDVTGRMGIDGDILRVKGPSQQVAHQVAAVLCEAARQYCAEAVLRHAKTIRQRVGKISMRDTRSRWGSCTSSGDLMFSWRLVLAPDHVIDYVVAHEVAHLLEMNHSPAFWAVVRRLCAEHELSRAWLRRHGPGLLALDFSDDA